MVEVQAGESTAQIARRLREQNLIRDPLAFSLYARYRNLDQRLRAGEYEVSRNLSAPQVIDVLVRGRMVTYPFTIPEGYTVRQIADSLAQKGLVDRDRFLAVARDPRNLPPEVPKGANLREPLEGYLFPDTYRVPRRHTEEDILRLMLDRFHQVFTPQYRQRAQELRMSVHQVVTLASIIEKEATSQDREQVAAVFENRLRLGMKLDSCATVNYVLDHPRLILTYQDLEVASPYNTYKEAGLPPGPIANPGEAAIRAALYPASVDYLYFVAKNDHEHAFARTYAEHLANRARYESQLGPGSQP
ncbi:MAG: endolytic transglycosylase MltG [Chloroflexi bacterium]|nr:endolytic transglycosylase MltG [Chloroflexota bacterium]